MRAIGRDVQRVAGQPVVGVGAVQRTLIASVAVAVDADGLPVVVRRIRGAVGDAEARHHLDVLGGVGAELDEVIEFLGGEAVGILPGIRGNDRSDVPDTSTTFGGVADSQRHVVIQLVAAAERDVALLIAFEALRGHHELVSARRHRREGVIAVGVGQGFALRARLLIAQCQRRAGDHRLRWIGHDSGECSVNGLSRQTISTAWQQRRFRQGI